MVKTRWLMGSCLLVWLLTGSTLAIAQVGFHAARGDSSVESVTISNLGAAGSSLQVSSLVIDDDTHFLLEPGGTCAALAFSLAGGESCTQLVRFSPQAIGTFSATLTVFSDAASVDNDQVALSGTAEPGQGPALQAVPGSLEFGLVAADAIPVDADVIVTNAGPVDTELTVTAIDAVGDTEFSVLSENCQAQILSGGDFCTVTIRFEATGDGSFSGALEVVSSAGSTSVPLNGAAQFPAQLAFLEQPVSTTIGEAIAPPVIVEVQDVAGDRVSLDNSTVITLSLAFDPSGQANLAGTLTTTVSNGVASFADLSLDQVGEGFTLIAVDGKSQLAPASSAAFDIFPGAPALLSFAVQPGDSAVGESISPPVVVQVLDSLGNLVTWDDSTVIGLTLSGGAPGALLSGGAGKTVSGGQASFSGLSVDTVGTAYQLFAQDAESVLAPAASDSFDVTSVDAEITISSIDPAGSQMVGQPYLVSVAVTGVNPTGTVTISDGQGASCLIVVGSASSCNLVSTSVGPRTIAADYPGDANNQPAAATAAYEIVAGAPDRLAFLVQPQDAVSDQVITPAVVVQVQDAFGNPVTSDESSEVALFLVDGTDGAVLTGGAATTVSAGLVTFAALAVDLAGSDFRLRADAAGLTSAFSDSFDVSAGAPFELIFDVQPSSVLPDSIISPAVSISVRDAAGNLVASDNSTQVNLQLLPGDPSAVLSNGGLATVVDGVATYANLSVDTVGSGYRLSADDAVGNLAGSLSDPFNVVNSESSLEIIGFDPPLAQTVGQAYEVLVALDSEDVSPTGLVTVSDDLGASCQFDVETQDRCSLVSVSAGNRIINAVYPGDDSVAASADQTDYSINPAQAELKIVAISPAGQQVINQPYQVEIELTGFQPSGPVVVDDGDGNVCVINLPADRCSLSSTSTGAKTITASYAGNVNNLGNVDSQGYAIVRAQSTTSILGLTPANQQTVGLPYTVTAVVAGQNPAGQISISDGDGAECQIDLDQGQTACELVSTSPGSRTIQAEYGGDDNNTSSSASSLYEIVSSGPFALAFSTQPDYGVVNGPLYPRLVVRVVDSLGLLVDADNSTEIEIRIETNPGGGELGGTLIKTVSNGVASFDNLSISALGQGYQLRARTPNLVLEPAITAPFDVISDQVFGDRFEQATDQLFRDRFEEPALPGSSVSGGSGLE